MTALNPSVTIDGVTLDLRVTRKRVKNINVRLVGNELRVSAPRWVSNRELDEAITTLARRMLRRERARTINLSDDALELARRVAKRFSNKPEIVAARFSTQQRSRWGSYSTRTRTIQLNVALRQMPLWVLEAVVAHELAHIDHPDHSPAFWELLRKVCPQTDRARVPRRRHLARSVVGAIAVGGAITPRRRWGRARRLSPQRVVGATQSGQCARSRRVP